MATIYSLQKLLDNAANELDKALRTKVDGLPNKFYNKIKRIKENLSEFSIDLSAYDVASHRAEDSYIHDDAPNSFIFLAEAKEALEKALDSGELDGVIAEEVAVLKEDVGDLLYDWGLKLKLYRDM
jgi:hypothetical protein